MKRLVLVMAIVFAFGVTYASNGTVEVKKAKTEQVSTVDKDKKEAKAEKSEKKEGCSKKEGCCKDKSKSSEKKSTDEKK
jgi:hypothetical protein